MPILAADLHRQLVKQFHRKPAWRMLPAAEELLGYALACINGLAGTSCCGCQTRPGYLMYPQGVVDIVRGFRGRLQARHGQWECHIAAQALCNSRGGQQALGRFPDG
ncbi:hypothetical protein LNQ52_00040 [Klebsiella pneumoniae subsp. pneumoniae]|nr:hypothetical protein [Klebsiella pneumoniae subsp. pneumoniae]